VPKLRFAITMSLDGYVAGPNQSLENPLGEGGLALHEWVFATKSFRATHGLGDEEGETGLDDDHAAPLEPERRRDDQGPEHVRPDPRQLGRERCTELVSSPVVAHYTYVRT
jgi:hypothetical protein